MDNDVAKKCSVCERTEKEVVLIKYPFTTAYNGLSADNESVKEEDYECLECIDEQEKSYKDDLTEKLFE